MSEGEPALIWALRYPDGYTSIYVVWGRHVAVGHNDPEGGLEWVSWHLSDPPAAHVTACDRVHVAEADGATLLMPPASYWLNAFMTSEMGRYGPQRIMLERLARLLLDRNGTPL